MVLVPSIARRRDAWLKELADALDQVEKKVEGFKVENLQNDDAFVSAVIDVSRATISTHKDGKRKFLCNALVNIALRRSTDEDEQQMFVRYIDELTVWHLRILLLFQNPSKQLASNGVRADYMMGGGSRVIEDMYPELRGKRDFYDQIANDLYSRGFLNSPPAFLHTTMSGGSGGMLAKRTTTNGDAVS